MWKKSLWLEIHDMKKNNNNNLQLKKTNNANGKQNLIKH